MPEPIALSVILPAYNEAARLPPHLAAVRQYLQARYSDRYEVIVVDDGSGDGLANVLDGLAAAWPQLRVIRHAQNQGKGAAVRTGMLAAGGALLLFADADGATPIEEEGRLAAAIRAGADLAVGSRLLSAAGTRRSRNWLRGLAGRSFAATARRLLASRSATRSAGSRCSAATWAGGCFPCSASQGIFSTSKCSRWPTGSAIAPPRSRSVGGMCRAVNSSSPGSSPGSLSICGGCGAACASEAVRDRVAMAEGVGYAVSRQLSAISYQKPEG